MSPFIEPPFWAHRARRGSAHQSVQFIDDGPPVEPMTLAEAKLHLRVHTDQADEDPLIERYITSARTYCENRLQRILAQRTCDVFLDSLLPYHVITLPVGPVVEVTSIKTTDTEGVQTTVDPALYLVDLASVPARIGLPSGQAWPMNLRAFQSVVIRLVVGYVQPAEDIVQAMRLLIGHYNEKRMAVQPTTEEALKLGVEDHLAPYEEVQVI